MKFEVRWRSGFKAKSNQVADATSPADGAEYINKRGSNRGKYRRPEKLLQYKSNPRRDSTSHASRLHSKLSELNRLLPFDRTVAGQSGQLANQVISRLKLAVGTGASNNTTGAHRLIEQLTFP